LPENEQDKADQRFRKDIEYYEANQEEILRQHPNRWVAVFNQEVVGTAPHLDDLLGQLHDQKLPVGQVFIEYAKPEEEILILVLE